MFGACALSLSTYLNRDFTMPQGVTASQSFMDKIHSVIGKGTEPKGYLLVLYRALRSRYTFVFR
jgi:hypothetical protein